MIVLYSGERPGATRKQRKKRELALENISKDHGCTYLYRLT
jgi:hypothetical protein